MYTEDETGNVVLTMSRYDFNELLLMLGFATGSLTQNDAGRLFGLSHNRALALVNRLNKSNPNYTPYEVEDEAGSRKME